MLIRLLNCHHPRLILRMMTLYNLRHPSQKEEELVGGGGSEKNVFTGIFIFHKLMKTFVYIWQELVEVGGSQTEVTHWEMFSLILAYLVNFIANNFNAPKPNEIFVSM